MVAPRTGAWIETSMNIFLESSVLVAPRTGAWIETELSSLGLERAWWSPLAQGRGLKHTYCYGDCLRQWSPLAQGRGLKPGMKFIIWRPSPVAPRTGAWIETYIY